MSEYSKLTMSQYNLLKTRLDKILPKYRMPYCVETYKDMLTGEEVDEDVD